MAQIVLVSLNARYTHPSLALRYLKANLGELEEQCELLEGTISDRPSDIVEQILELEPIIVGFSVHIWSVAPTTAVVRQLKLVAPQVTIVIGGPEVSYETDRQEICELADYVVLLEGDLLFAELCRRLLAGDPPANKVQFGARPKPESLTLPYNLYTEEDLRHRTVYLEASRGCPFRCSFCLSSLDPSVRSFDLDRFEAALAELWHRGARQFKFIDRTFNLKVDTGLRLLRFFRERYEPGLFVHFEMIPDRFPSELKDAIREFPGGCLQFEVGVQTFDPEVAARIERRQNYRRVEENLLYLRAETGVHLHVDLIVGLPGEDLEGFGRGFDRLWALGPQEIQVGILKRLRGTPLVALEEEFDLRYSPDPPYELLHSSTLTFQELQLMKRFARFWDLIANRGLFRSTLESLLAPVDSAFHRFLELSEELYRSLGTTHKIGAPRLALELFAQLQKEGWSAAEAAELLASDLQRDRPRPLPKALREALPADSLLRSAPRAQPTAELPERQRRHAAAGS